MVRTIAKVIPAMDIYDQKCVRLKQGKFENRKVYPVDPFKTAVNFEAAGLHDLHIIDLNGARGINGGNRDIISRICRQTSLSVFVGGGIGGYEGIKKLIDIGASGVTITGLAVKKRKEFEYCLREFGPEKIRVAADVDAGFIACDGWRTKTELPLFSFIEEMSGAGVKYILCTDIAKDGMLMGPTFELYSDLTDRFKNINFIASGGITTVHEIKKLSEMGIWGVIAGKSIYEGLITLPELTGIQQGLNHAD